MPQGDSALSQPSDEQAKRDQHLEALQESLSTALALAVWLISAGIRDELDSRAPLTAVTVAELIAPISQSISMAEQLRLLYELQDRQSRPPEPVVLSEREQFAVSALLDVTRDLPPRDRILPGQTPATCVSCLTPATELAGHGMHIDKHGLCDRCRGTGPCQQ